MNESLTLSVSSHVFRTTGYHEENNRKKTFFPNKGLFKTKAVVICSHYICKRCISFGWTSLDLHKRI